MNNWKKTGLMLTMSSAVLLGACGNGDSSASNEVTISYNIWDQMQADAMQAVINAFEDENPDVNVNLQVTPWDQYWTQMEAAGQGGSLPDVFWMHSNEIASFSQGNILYDMSEHFVDNEDLDANAFPEELVELYTVDDQILGVPKDYDTVGLWYNQTMFDEAGIDYPDESWTWEDLLEAAQELTNEDEGVYGILAHMNRQEGFHNFIYQNGGYVLSNDKTQSGFREQETIDAVQWYADLSVEHGISPTQNDFADNSVINYLQSGRGAMAILGSWHATEMASNEYTAENIDVAMLPMGSERATIFNGLAHSIAASTDHPEEAVRFVEFLSSEEGMRLQGEHGAAIPARLEVDQAFIEGFPEFNVKALIDQLEYGVIKPYSRFTSRWENAEHEALIPVFNGTVTVEEIADDLADEVENVLESE